MDPHVKKHIGRFAPTPSGDMHLGNLLCALIAYLSVKSKGGEFIIRIEDLDSVRCPRHEGQRLIDALGEFGLESDRTPVFQSDNTALYRSKEQELACRGYTYPCFCTRAQLHAAEAPRLADGGVVYSGACRSLSDEQKRALSSLRRPCIRIKADNECISFEDGIKGKYTQDLARECGDFIIRRSDGVYAYQLAVAVDDGEAGVTEVVRGDDLIASTPRQIWLMRLLGYSPPQYYHIPLVCDSKGRKLSKSEGDKIALNVKRLPRERILGSLAYSAGILEEDRAADMAELIALYSPQKIKTVIRLSDILI